MFILFFPAICGAQDGRGDLRLVFYNVENLFDPFDDSLVRDDEFLPSGPRHWTWERFLEKERRIYKVLVSAGDWRPPELIGLCEVENRFVLKRLVRDTPLLKYNYRMIHRDSPDDRGMDLALLYLETHFRPMKCTWLPVAELPTREVLYVCGLAMERDTLHLILCHWPSRWEGYVETMDGRIRAARLVRRLADSITRTGGLNRVLIAGDLNDETRDPSLSRVLRVKSPPHHPAALSDTCIYDTGSTGQETGEVQGSLKYGERWYEFDHILVNGAFLRDTLLYVRSRGKRIHEPDFLLEQDPAGTGKRPFRTYRGYSYCGGYSDHLPVYIDLWRGE